MMILDPKGEEADLPKYRKGVIHIFHVGGGVIAVNDDHVISVDTKGAGSQTYFASEAERKGTIDAMGAYN